MREIVKKFISFFRSGKQSSPSNTLKHVGDKKEKILPDESERKMSFPTRSNEHEIFIFTRKK